MKDALATSQTTNSLVGPLADLIADIVEGGGSHPWDDGFSEQLRRDGYTEAGKRRLIEELRERARIARQTDGKCTPEALRDHADNLDSSARYWVCGVLRDAADEIERLTRLLWEHYPEGLPPWEETPPAGRR